MDKVEEFLNCSVSSFPFYSIEYGNGEQSHYERYYDLNSLKSRLEELDLSSFRYEICECRILAIDALIGECNGN